VRYETTHKIYAMPAPLVQPSILFAYCRHVQVRPCLTKISVLCTETFEDLLEVTLYASNQMVRICDKGCFKKYCFQKLKIKN